MIRAVLIDIDDTLLDFRKCSHDAMHSVMESVGLAFEESMFVTFEEINTGLWKQVEQKTLTGEELYKIRWNRIFDKLGICYDGEAFETMFHNVLCTTAIPVDHAELLLRELSNNCPVYAASNGGTQQQLRRLKLAGMLTYLKDVFTSEDFGVPKPSSAFFDEAFRRMNILPEEAVMIGDSLSADISGAVRYGIHTIWFNKYGNINSSQVQPDAVVTDLLEIPGLISSFS